MCCGSVLSILFFGDLDCSKMLKVFKGQCVEVGCFIDHFNGFICDNIFFFFYGGFMGLMQEEG